MPEALDYYGTSIEKIGLGETIMLAEAEGNKLG